MMNRHDRRGLASMRARFERTKLSPLEAQKALSEMRALVKARIPLLVERGDTITREIYDCKDPSLAVSLCAETFAEIADWFRNYPADSVWVAFSPALIAVADALGSIEEHYKRSGVEPDAETRAMIGTIREAMNAETDPGEIASRLNIGYQKEQV